MLKKPPPAKIPLFRRDFLGQSALSGVALGVTGLPTISWAVRGDQLHVHNYNDIVSLDPPHSVSGAEGNVMRAIFRSLLQIKADGSWDTELDAAEYFEQLDDTHYAFRLKPGIMYTNGFGEMTAEDVKYSLERVVDPATNALNGPDLATFSHVDVHDRYSGTLVLKSPYAAFLTVGLAGMSCAIFPRKAIESVGGRFTVFPPCCCGPYYFKDWQANRKTILAKNPDWLGPEAAFSEIHVYPMVDAKAGELAFEAGQLDFTLITVESVDSFRRNLPPDASLNIYPSGRSSWLGMNSEHPALKDIRIRKAIQYAVDVEAIVEAGWFGLANPSTGPIPEGMIGHREDTSIPAYGDLEKARQLLDEAGAELPLKLTLHAANAAIDSTVTQVIQWSLKKVGIEVEIIMQDNNTFLDLGMESKGDQWRDSQLWFQDFVGGADPYYSMTWFIADQIGQWNWERFNSPEFDKLNDLALATTDIAERDRMYQRMQDLMEESGSYRFICNGVMPQLSRSSIVPAVRPDGYPQLRAFKPAEGAV